MDALTIEKVEGSGYEIRVNGEEIGYIESNQNFLTQIEIFPDYRGHGYGTEAVRQFVEKQREAGATYVETSSVVSSQMEAIVLKLGFDRAEGDESHWRLEL